MKCNRCGQQVRDNDKICINCGNTLNEEDEKNNSDAQYMKELDDLLNSYDNDKNAANRPDYSDFQNVDEPVIYENYANDDSSYETNSNDDYNVKDLVTITKDTDNNDYGYIEDKSVTNFFKRDKNEEVSIVPFKIIIIVAGVISVLLVLLLMFKVFTTDKNKSTEFKSPTKDNKITSKYSLKENPNYIKGKTWICGNDDGNGNLAYDPSAYFQYDFNNNSTYAMQFLNKDDSYEDGTYSISLEDISDNGYTYKVVALANLAGGYKTKYTFTLVTDKEGKTATYKMNDKVSKCEEMNFYNSKVKK